MPLIKRQHVAHVIPVGEDDERRIGQTHLRPANRSMIVIAAPMSAASIDSSR